MGDMRTTRLRRPLALRTQTLRVLGYDDLGQVVGGVTDGDHLQVRKTEQRCPTRRCLDP